MRNGKLTTESGPAVVHLLCGLPASGKTTFARSLEGPGKAVRFTLDEWMKSLYTWSIDDDEYGPATARCQQLIWQMALQVLATGQDVILDWSLWSADRRRKWTSRVEEAGYEYRLYYLREPLEELRRRLKNRNEQAPAGTHVISLEELDRFAPIFEVPTEEEALNLIEVS